MSNKRKFSLSFINSASLIIFLMIVSVGISTWGYFNTQNVIEYNIREYFKQTSNITNIILEQEERTLNDITFEISEVIDENKSLDEFDSRISAITSVDQIDILFLKDGGDIKDLSNTLFDTEAIIEELTKLKINLDNSLVSLDLDNEKYILLLSSKKIIDKKSGRVSSTLYAGKIFNDNFSLINNIKQKAALEDVYIYYSNELISTTSTKEILDINMFNQKSIIEKNGLLYFNKVLKTVNQEEVNIVFVTLNSTFELIKEQFIKAGVALLVFIVFTFIVLYIFSKKLILNPFSKLLEFARNAKDNEHEKYNESMVQEFDNFAVNLKEIIDELRDIKEQYSRAIEGVQDGLWDIDLIRNKHFFSNRYLEMLGYSKEDKIDDMNFWKESVHKEDYRKTLKKLSHHLKGETPLYEDEYRFRCKDGSYKWIKVRGRVFFDKNNKPVKVTGFHTDIEDFIKLQKDNDRKEQMIYQQSKLAAMGEMIGNIAHQWRQPLNIISTIASSQIMQIELNITKKEETLNDLNKVVETVQYLSTIIEKFRNFFNPNKELEEFCLKDIIEDNLEIFETSYKSYGIKLIIDLKQTEIIGYKFELMQVLINIINNSKDALLEKYTNEDDKYIFIENFQDDGFHVIRIYDNAGGIKESIKEKIFEPYFTTKHQAQGTGLGLYMSNEIIKKHFNGQLLNETITYEYNGQKLEGEEFLIKIPI